jgi:integrase
MAEARFYLKTATGKKPSSITVKYNRGENRIQFSTGLSIKPEQWSTKAQRARKSLTGFSEFNAALDRIAATVELLVNECISVGDPVNNDSIRERYYAAIGKQRQVTVKAPDFIETLDDYIEKGKLKLSTAYLKTVGTMKGHLEAFKASTGHSLSFDKIDLGFYNDFTDHLLKKGLANNSIAINVSRLKRFLQWCSVKRIYTLDFHKHKEFHAKEDETDSIALSEAELMTLYKLELPSSGTASHVRDLFCFAAFTALRFSDVSKLKREHFYQDAAGDWWLTKWIEKTKSFLEVPLSPEAVAIVLKNDFKFKVISSQKTNDHLKELGRIAGIDTPTLKTIYRGAVKDEATHPKYELLSFHCARRTFATLSLEKGMRPEVVMKFTGHKTLKSFMKYVKISQNILKLEIYKAWSNTETPNIKALSA